MNARWTRDEVILGLDVLFSSQLKDLSVESDSIIELSKLLNELPIIPESERDETFRNPAGVSNQLSRFEWGLRNTEKKARINPLFDKINNQFRSRKNDLKKIALAIRNNFTYTRQIGVIYNLESEVFPEGFILYSMHCYLEQHQGLRFSKKAERCNLCSISPRSVYAIEKETSFLEPHLLVPPEGMEPEMRLTEKDFIILCPNCHKILHQLRPWCSRTQCERIFKTLG